MFQPGQYYNTTPLMLYTTVVRTGGHSIRTKLGRGTVWVFGKLHNNQRQVKTMKLCLTSQPYAFIKYTGGLFHIRVTIAQARKTDLNTSWKPSF